MPDVDWSSVVPTLVGAVVGGALTLVGSIFASTRDVRRQRRLHIYEELLPQFDRFEETGREETTPAWLDRGVWPWLATVRRNAALTGPAERRMVRRIVDLHREYRAAERADLARSMDRELLPHQEKARQPDDLIDDLDKAVEKYRRLLERKIR